MSDIFFSQLDIPLPDYNLNINSMSHGEMTGKMLIEIEKVILKEIPDLVFIYGDTNSTLAGALAARKLHFQVAHIEAGLRSFNMKMPEEINRILADRISNYLFCPTQQAVDNLIKEGYNDFDCKIVLSGDVMQDAAVYYSEKAVRPSLELPEKFILSTIHRAENTDDLKILGNILKGLSQAGEKTPVVLPLHPRTRKIINTNHLEKNTGNIFFIDPVGYLEMIWLLKNCKLVITDSGGLQKEAFFFGKACVTIREQTEWVELVENGFNVIAGTNTENICNQVNKMLNKKLDFSIDLYGNGNAAQNIMNSVCQ